MRSPFPGMDPYLEQNWEDVHPALIGYVRDALAAQLPADLIARMEQRVYLDAGDGYPQVMRKPDVRVVERPLWTTGGGSPMAAVAMPPAAEPVLLDFATEPVTENYVVVMDARGNRVVTAVEVVSPANKIAGAGRRAYVRKRDEFLASETSLVEVDLVRAGEWVTLLHQYLVPRPYHTTYRVSVRRATPDSKGELYPIRLADPLPTVRVPLRDGEPDVRLDLQAVVDRAYLYGGYANTDYAEPCDPPLTGDEAAWADALLRAAGRRG